jgi:hypothetical protein
MYCKASAYTIKAVKVEHTTILRARFERENERQGMYGVSINHLPGWQKQR